MARLLKAKEAADLVYAGIRERVSEHQRNGVQPRLATLLIEGDPASAYYAKSKQRMAEKLGIAFDLHDLPADISADELIRLIHSLNTDARIHGMMLELPLPKHLSATNIAARISPLKDIDGVTPANKLATLTGEAGLYPATPQACIELLRHYGYPLEGRNVTLIGRGQTVGLPLFHLLQREQATVTVCHSRTPDIASHLRYADIAIVAAGRPGIINREMVQPNPKLIVIDAGINETADGSIIGDAAADVCEAATAVSPVPGGVGTLTTAVLFRNLMDAIQLQHQATREENNQ
ncbi:bifunctional 5,10-methylenetetrahydrofolate dehydrogenase/5,10-methenyltetrahydrofolate cyclohydrolase [Paenibacillus albus]|uniref:Bifunctional protein FolD n=1 Tax=Paenibacillus albus TaxID=2495582 RepID=A0A3S9ACX2_9BACL|nr:bifunctional 5,10-methylenetetrahydrofolate dehydrogenase/5,10-methenyltetrahydrofolate cyclohydrolase [Paenibacillus albus]AZN43569.1 bifunctional 5,10-methylenetetrahydrofolate dehydrogenase/5,10-methenyltetrahydrofolate cyclohydrolase [Paenibacillus albus]